MGAGFRRTGIPMKFIKWLILGLVAIIVIATVVAFLLPKTVYVSRSQSISAPIETVFAQVNNLKNFNTWSPWARRDPNTRYEYSGPDDGVGAAMEWDSTNPQVGSGTQVIVESHKNEFVKVTLNFGKQGTGVAHYTLNAVGGHTEITWAFETDLGYNPIARYMGIMFEDWVGADYETGLARLKTVLENAESSSN